MRATYFAQLKALLWRNLLLKRRNNKQLFQEVFFPLMYIGILIMIRALAKPSTKPAIELPVIQVSEFNYHFDSSKSLLVASNGLSVTSAMTKISARLNVTYQVFNTEEEMLNAYNADNGTIAAGVIFGYGNNSLIQHYAIRMKSVPDTGANFTPAQDQGQCRADSNNGNGRADYNCAANQYLLSGFAYMQNVINQVLMEELGLNVPDIEVNAQMMPKDEYTPDLTSLQTVSSIYFVLAYSFFINFLTVNLVAEKEKKIREGMLMMGLRNSVFWFSWSLVYFVIILVVTSVVTGIAAVGNFLENSNFFLMWLMLMLYGLSIIALAFLFTPFFNKARTAGVLASFGTILISLLYLAVSLSRTRTKDGYDYGVPPGAQWAMCLLSPVALALGMDRGIWLDVSAGGMTFDNMGTGDFPLYAPIIMLVLDIFLYFILAVYLDHVIPGEYGPRYKPLYFLEKSYWFPKQSGQDDRTGLLNGIEHRDGADVPLEGANIEPVSADMRSKRTMRVINILKTFKTKEKGKKKTITAVKNLSLDMYEGQITCILGHNGAGKTTLINMLTGVLPPTAGTATIRGLDVSCSGDMEEIRSMCGICPQHNILYDELTAKEHLLIFAGIKGVPADKTEAEVNRAMNSVDLLDQADVLASKLSGGQKRKLSVAMALIGDPKIIFLDEPTAGMDPYSRRHLWSLLKSSKEGRLILLTTHFMDEADILSDRKAIISKGQLKCCGSSLFLKSKFGIGYHLNMVVEPSCSADTVLELLQQHVDGVEFERSHGKELSFRIPLAQVSNFASLFMELEKRQGNKTVAETLGILNYGVSMPTLEEVFLKLGDEEDDEEGSGFSNPSYNALSHLDVDLTEQNGQRKASADHTEIQMRSNQQDPFHVVSHFSDDKARRRLFFWMMIKLRFLAFWRVKIALVFLILLPIGLIVGALVINKQSTSSSTPDALALSGALYAKGASGTSSDEDPLPFVVQDSVSNTISQAISSFIQGTYQVDSYPTSTNLSDVAPHWVGTNLLSTDATGNNLANYTALFNDSAFHSLPSAISIVTDAIMQQAGSSDTILTYSLPWPSNKRDFDNGAFSSSLMIGIAFSLIVPVFGSVVVQERQWKCKSQLRISGTSFHMYWGSTFVFDLLLTLIPATIGLIITLAMQIPSFTPAGAIVTLILLFILFIPQSLLLSLLSSFLFDKYETAQAVLPNVFIWAGMVPYLAVSLLDMLLKETVATVLHSIFVFLDPIYIIFGGFYYIDKIYRIAAFTEQSTPPVGEYFKFSNNILICFIASIFNFFVMYLLLRILEVRSEGGTVREALRCGDVNTVRNIPETNSDTVEDEDADVAQERRNVELLEQGSGNTQDCVAYVSQIRKEFMKSGKAKKPCTKPPPEKVKVAVRNLSFAVYKGEVFGLLGPNGAGKTTALSTMTAEVHPSKGKVMLGSHNIRSNMSEAFRELGFCPQHDALWELITLEEHLEIYAALKGIPKNEIPLITDYFVENLKLQEHRHKQAKKLSGGTKRKLCYAISMLGAPKCVLLDEPSTGMDPQSKRFLWDTVSSSFEGQDRGAILTTHYMEEADALCTRVGIMVNGQMECLGPTQHLKAKFGSGYLLEVKLGGGSSASREALEERMEVLEQHLITVFPNATCLESFAERAQYKIPQSDVTVLSAVFAALESTKQTHRVEEYSFSQSTLEQVFLNFAKKQLVEGEEESSRDRSVPARQLSKKARSSHETSIQDDSGPVRL